MYHATSFLMHDAGVSHYLFMQLLFSVRSDVAFPAMVLFYVAYY